MSGEAGQPVRRTSLVFIWLGRVLAVTAGLVLVTVGALLVWLSLGPMDVTRLVRHFAPHKPGAIGFSLAHADIFWDRHARQSPLVVTLRYPMLVRGDGSLLARAGSVQSAVLFPQLLVGKLRPLWITVAEGSVALRRDADGGFGLDDGQPARASQKSNLLNKLARVDVSAFDVVVTDRKLTMTWHGRVGRLAADHLDNGRIAGTADISADLAGQSTRVVARLTPLGVGTVLDGAVTGFNPVRLAAEPAWAGAGVMDLPLAGQFRLVFGDHWQPRTLAGTLQVGAGRIRLGEGIPIASGGGQLEADFVAHRMTVPMLHLMLQGRDGAGPMVSAQAALAWAGPKANLNLDLGLDRVEFAELGRYWPAGLAHGARDWLTKNVTGGAASDAQFNLGLELDHGVLSLIRANGHLQAQDVTLYWLRPVPPLQHASANLTLQSPDALLITIPAASQAPSDAGQPVLRLANASMRITGLTVRDQQSVIEGDLAGPVTQTLALLREKRLKLLAVHPMDFGVPSGSIAAHLTVKLPLDNKVTVDQIGIHATGRLSDLHLGGVIGGKDLDRGALALDVGNDGLKLDGTADLAAIPSHLAVTMDFRSGAPDQVVTTYVAGGTASIAQLASAGIPVAGVADGSLDYAANVAEQRSGRGTAQVHVDLKSASLAVGAVGWQKARDTDSVADARLVLDHDRLVGVDQLSVVGPGVSVKGRASYQQGKPVALTFDEIVLGRTRAAGEIRFPTDTDPNLYASLHGSLLDLSSRLKPDKDRHVPGRAEAQAAARARKSAARATARGRPWKADLSFDEVRLGDEPAQALEHVSARAENDGLLLRRAQVNGTAGHGAFHLTLAPTANGRTLEGTAQDAGGLLHALDLVSAIQGGRLKLAGVYDDTLADHPLSGSTDIDAFRITGAPAMARVLQAMTLYGVVDVLRGPGLGITHLVAPFGFADSVLTINNARAFSGSLGFTTKGEIDLAASRADLTGTIVPAYFFNTLLGRVPLVGRLFSPEKGGGVFAATYGLSGPLDNLKVQVNPLAALTPGFLRGLFGIFDAAAPAPAVDSAPAATATPASPPPAATSK